MTYNNRREANEQRAMENHNPMARELANRRRAAQRRIDRMPHMVIADSDHHKGAQEGCFGPFNNLKAAKKWALQQIGTIHWYAGVRFSPIRWLDDERVLAQLRRRNHG